MVNLGISKIVIVGGMEEVRGRVFGDEVREESEIEYGRKVCFTDFCFCFERTRVLVDFLV